MSDDDVAFMRKHNIADFVEQVLSLAVPQKAERPFEVIGQSALVPTLPTTVASRLELLIAGSPAIDSIEPAQLASFDFDVFSYDQGGNDLILLMKRIFDSYDALAAAQVPTDVFFRWMLDVQCHYHAENSYHNFRHAFNVVQTLHVFLTTYEAKKFFSTIDIFALLFAAVCHDIEHPGFNNDFCVNTGHPLAVRYNDRSPLENHHSALAFALPLSDPAVNVLQYVRGSSATVSEMYRDMRRLVTRGILATDLGQHKAAVAALKAVVEQGFNISEREHKEALFSALLQAADVSNEIRSFVFSRQWAPLVQEEFHRQGDKARALGLPVKPMFDRSSTETLATAQIGFIDHVCMPLYEQLAKVVPPITFCVANLASNKNTWVEMNAPPQPPTPPTPPTQQ